MSETMKEQCDECGTLLARVRTAQERDGLTNATIDRMLASHADAMESRIAALERAEVERRAGGYWSCTGCAATPDVSGAWRWEGDRWAHRCPGNPPQAGHEPARWFGRGAPTGPDGLPMVERNTPKGPPPSATVEPKVWPVGSCPPPAVGQVRVFSGSSYRIECKYRNRFDVLWDSGLASSYPADALESDPIAEPWTEPAATPAPSSAELEARVAALTAERDALASQLAMMSAEAIALREERNTMAENVATLIVERDGAANRRNEAEDREKQRGAQAASLIAKVEAERDAAVKRAEEAEAAQEGRVEWVVNDNAELGVRIGGVCYFLYKGNSLVYRDGKHDDGRPMMVRLVGKREFGECCSPLGMTHTPRSYTVGDGWEFMKAVDGAHVGASESEMSETKTDRPLTPAEARALDALVEWRRVDSLKRESLRDDDPRYVRERIRDSWQRAHGALCSAADAVAAEREVRRG